MLIEGIQKLCKLNFLINNQRVEVVKLNVALCLTVQGNENNSLSLVGIESTNKEFHLSHCCATSQDIANTLDKCDFDRVQRVP